MSHAQYRRVPRQRPPWRALAIVAAVVAALVLVSAVYIASERAQVPTGSPGPAPGSSTVLGPSEPVSVAVPSIGASSSLIGLGLNADRSMTTPPLSQPGQASWYTGGPQPGTRGPAVILGHINGNGRPGVFARLAEVRPGALVNVARADHTVATFTVDRVDTVPKTAFPSEQVFGRTADAQLRLITCGGDLDGSKHSYESNVLVFAHLTGSRPA